MIKNYLKIALRNLLRNKFYSLLNITGLAIGVACCLLIVLFVSDELSYDRYYEESDNIYRVVSDGALNGTPFDIAVAAPVVGPTLVNDFPEVVQFARFRQNGQPFIRYEDNVFKEESFIWADQSILDIFDIELVMGDPETALTAPNSLVMSREAAEKYFGKEDPIGKLVQFGRTTGYQITGIFEEIPSNTHFQADVLGSLITLDPDSQTSWFSMNFQTYIVLQDGADPKILEDQFPAMLKKYMGPEVKQFLNTEWDDMESTGNSFVMSLQPVVDIHLHSDMQAELAPNNDVNNVYIFSAIAFFILLIACINFMNLSTARSAHRAKEVGVRKVLGSLKSQLVNQFLAESIIISFISFVLAVAMAYGALPFFNTLANKELSIPFTNPVFYAAVFGGIFGVGLLAGSYPAFFLSAFQPVKVLKGSLSSGMKSGALRNVLVTIQFLASIFLVIGTLVIRDQLSYIQNKKLGFDKDQVLVIHDAFLAGSNASALKTRMETFPEVKSASLSSFLPTPSSRNNNAFIRGLVPSQENTLLMGNWFVDYEYMETMGMEIIEGRNFSRDFATDSSACIINEAAAKLLGYGDETIGGIVGEFASLQGDISALRVIGVVKDFHYESLRDNIQPLLLELRTSGGLLNLKVNTDNYPALINRVEAVWDELAPSQPFETSFLDDRFSRIYDAEQRQGQIFGVFALLAILIACLGLFGLSSYTAENRLKEVGIRKVLGANVGQLVMMLSKDITKLVLIAFVIGAPLGWYLMNQWLQEFEYRTSIGVMVFVIAASGSILIALLTTSYQSLRAAMRNPVKSLRTE